jgi:hypothetical protein
MTTTRKNVIDQTTFFMPTLTLVSDEIQTKVFDSTKKVAICPIGYLTWDLSNLLSLLNHLPDTYIFKWHVQFDNNGQSRLTIWNNRINLFSISFRFNENPQIEVLIYRESCDFLGAKITQDLAFLCSTRRDILLKAPKIKLASMITLTLALQKPVNFNRPGLFSPLDFKEYTTDNFQSFLQTLFSFATRGKSSLRKQLQPLSLLIGIIDEKPIGDLSLIVDRFGGFFSIYYVDQNQMKDGLYLDFNNHRGTISNFIYIFPEAAAILNSQKVNCIELDCTFKFMRPYVLSIICAIIMNSYIPLGFFVAPSEKAVYFTRFYDAFKSYTNIDLTSITVLSDRGSGINKFCTTNNIDHVYCVAHTIRLIGNNNHLTFTLKRLLQLTDVEEVNNFLSEFSVTFSEELLQESFLKTISSIGLSVVDNFVTPDPGSPLFYQSCLAYRVERGIPSTSNSLESLHSHLNDLKLRNTTYWMSISRMMILLQHRFLLFESCIQHNYNLQVYRLSHLLTSSSQEFLEDEVNLLHSTIDYCLCKKNIKINRLFDIDFPCIHRLFKGAKFIPASSITIPKFSTERLSTDLKFTSDVTFKTPKKEKAYNHYIDSFHYDYNRNMSFLSNLIEELFRNAKKFLPDINSIVLQQNILRVLHEQPFFNDLSDLLLHPSKKILLFHYCVCTIQKEFSNL